MDSADGRPGARHWWVRIESVHAVTYFTPTSRQALAPTGLRGFWMGYFAGRAAPLGPVGPEVVTAAFFNFHPIMVRRSLPEAWSFAEPSTVLEARAAGAAGALRAMVPSLDQRVVPLLSSLGRLVDSADGSGRILFSANRAVPVPADPVRALWQFCTSMREHRGDGHVAALTSAGLDGCEALVLFSLSEGVPASLFLESRGWSPGEWELARHRLESRGLVVDQQITPEGSALRRSIEETTDQLAARPFAALGPDDRASLYDGLDTIARHVVATGVIPHPNPMGLPQPD